MGRSRTANTILNFITSIGGQLLQIVLKFVVRTVFINTLGVEYLGINGLFTNILQMLSLAELGFGTASLFKLYEPLAKSDKKRITLLLKFYKKIYIFIGCIIFIIGLLLIPFLRYIVSDYDSLEPLGINAVLIYILYLIKTAVSYFFMAYKSAIIRADQKEYKLTVVSYLVSILSSGCQILVLFLFKSYELYLTVFIGSAMLQNFLNARIAKKLYPYIDDKYDEKIDNKEIKEIFKDCMALLFFKINGVVLKATDNIVISMFLGLNMVGIYSNYYIIYNSVTTIFARIFDSVLHSLGNLHTEEDKEHEYVVYKDVNYIASMIGAFAGIGIACISNEFITAWIGESWLIPQPFAILIGIEIFGLSSRQYLGKYRSAFGLFQQAKMRPLFGILINIVASVLLVKPLGICGVILGTILSDWLTVMWFDPYIIHKYGFKNKFSIWSHYKRNLYYTIVTALLGTLCYLITTNIALNMGWISVIIHAIIVSIIVIPSFIIIFYNTDYMGENISIVKNILDKIFKKKLAK